MVLFFFLLKAWVIGIAIAAPVGPIGVLCIRKTLEFGLVGALAVGLGAALADSIYGMIAATGLTVISHFLLKTIVVIKLAGGLFLLYLAYLEFMNKLNNPDTIRTRTHDLGKLLSEVFILTLTNPMTILSFTAIFAGIGGETIPPGASLMMVMGIFLGSMTWWIILGLLILKLKRRLPEVWIGRIRFLSAVILAVFGVFAILTALN